VGGIEMKKDDLLRLDLQFFAEGDDNIPQDEPENKGNGSEQEKRFTQAEVEEIVKKRLDRERRKAEERLAKEREELERKKLEEQQEFKALYEKTLAELDALKAEAHRAKLESLTTSLLVEAGYVGEQLERVRKYITGADEDEIKASIEELKKDIPPKSVGVDPSVGNTPKQQPKQKDLAEEGRSLYQLLKAKGKIRR
jgi:hypothetical protein